MFIVLGSSPSPELLSHGPLLECKPCAHDNLVFWSIRSPGLITRPRMGPSLGFVTDVFLFFVLSSVTYYGLFYCTIEFVMRHWRLIAPMDLYSAIVSRYYLSFK